MTVIPILGRWKQEGLDFNAIPDCIRQFKDSLGFVSLCPNTKAKDHLDNDPRMIARAKVKDGTEGDNTDIQKQDPTDLISDCMFLTGGKFVKGLVGTRSELGVSWVIGRAGYAEGRVRENRK